MGALVITLREGVEAALVVSIILGYLQRSGRAVLNRYVYAGLVLAILASVVAAVGFSLIGFDPENEVLEGSLLAAASVLVASLVVWMWRASRTVKDRIESRLEALGSRRAAAGWGLLGLSFFMVFREGVEIVLFLAALSLTATDSLLNLIGGLAGLGLAALLGLLLIKGSVRLDLRRFFAVTAVVLVILIVRLLAGSIHEFSEVGLLPSTPRLLSVIGFIVRDSTSLLILTALILLPVLALLPGLRARPGEEASREGEGSAERRKRLAALRNSRRWGIAAMLVTLIIATPLLVAAYASTTAGFRPRPAELMPTDKAVRIPTGSLEPGRLYKFLVRGSAEDVRFILIKRSEVDIASALDACGICPPAGYYQDRSTVLCDNCTAPINLATIGIAGGCNPLPVPAALSGGELVLTMADLLGASSGRFAR